MGYWIAVSGGTVTEYGYPPTAAEAGGATVYAVEFEEAGAAVAAVTVTEI